MLTTIVLGTFASIWMIVRYLRARQQFRRVTEIREKGSDSQLTTLPPVSVIVPVFGSDQNTETCFRKWLGQKYSGEFEVVFSLQNQNDPALELLKQLQMEFKFKTTINPVRNGFSGKSSNLYHGFLGAEFETIVCADSDTFPDENMLQSLILSLKETKAAFVCAAPVPGKSQKGFWQALGNEYLNLGIAHLLGVDGPQQKWLFGACFATSKKVLQQLDGFARSADSLPEDLSLGYLAQKAGLAIAIGGTIECPSGEDNFNKLWHRAMRSGAINAFVVPFAHTLLTTSLTLLYFPFLMGALLFQNSHLLYMGLILLGLRVLTNNPWKLNETIGSGGSTFPIVPLVLSDAIHLISLFASALMRRVKWRGQWMKISAEGQNLQP
jgi:GT2 family glycosyltransferase